MRKKVVAGNWKCNTTVQEGVELVKGMNVKKYLTPEELAFWVPLFDTVLKGEKQSFEFNQAFGSVIHYFHTS